MGKQKSISVKFMLIVSGISAVLFAILAVVIMQTSSRAQLHQSEEFKGVIQELLAGEKQTLSAELEKKGQSLAGLLSLSASSLIIGYDFDALQRLADNAMQDDSIVYATFFGKDGKPLTRTSDKQEEGLKKIQGKISFENEEIGTVEIGLSLALIKEKEAEAATRNSKLAAATDANMRKAGRALMIVVLCSALAGGFFLCLAIFLSLRRYVVQPVGQVAAGLIQGAQEVTSASYQLESSSQDLAGGSSEQAASLEETTSSLEELLAMSRRNAENSRHGDDLMREAQAVVEKANNSMARQTEAMSAISRASEETSKIIKTIDEIAFQTNLLALNAAVEAARAGEAGAGFAVVAEEVRNLAMRAATAAKDTETLIAGIVRQVHEGADHVRQTNEEFAQMSGKIAKVGSLVTEIAAASGEQTVGFDQISSAMLAIDKVTQQTAASAEESASAATEMHAQAAKLQEYVGELLALIGRTHPAADPGGSAPGHEAGQRKEKVAPVQTPSAKRQKKLPERPQPAEMEEFENF